MIFFERTYRDANGAVIIQSRLGPALARQGFENQIFPGVQVGLSGWERAHSQGGGTGHESPFAIRYAPQEVNQKFQRLGIERYLRELLAEKPGDVDLWLTTVTSTYPGALRLREIQYRVDAVTSAGSRRLFEARIEISNQKIAPRVSIQATPYSMP
jgi:hypothetical protein